MAANDNDPLNLPVRVLLERLLDAQKPDAEWVNVRDDLWPWRHMVAAAERGECAVSRVGRKLLVRREELNRWLATYKIPARPRGGDSGDSSGKPGGDDGDSEHIERMLEDAGFRRR